MYDSKRRRLADSQVEPVLRTLRALKESLPYHRGFAFVQCFPPGEKVRR